jgi:hypothetical protein
MNKVEKVWNGVGSFMQLVLTKINLPCIENELGTVQVDSAFANFV